MNYQLYSYTKKSGGVFEENFYKQRFVLLKSEDMYIIARDISIFQSID